MILNKIDLWDEIALRQKYLILAGTNKYGRQLYLNGYVDDETAWDISTVPIPMTKTKCNKIIKIAQNQLPALREKYPRKYKDDISFEIIDYIDKYNGVL